MRSRFVAGATLSALLVTSAVSPIIGLVGSPKPAFAGDGGATKSVSMSRVHLVGGKDKTVDRRTVTVTVDTTSGLRDRQVLNVTWRGAHPSGGSVADQNSGAAALQEYPMVLMQCRGVDSKSVPAAQRLRPETCWTQTPYERFSNEYNTTVPPWRLDRFAASSERRQFVNEPKKRPVACFGAAQAERWLPFIDSKGKVYPGGPNGCAGTAPEATVLGGLSLPSNTTYASTSASGGGSAKFNVRSSVSNASLGCSDKVKCSLVVVPIMGVSCDSDATGLPSADRLTDDELAAARARCEAEGKYAPGSNYNPSIQADSAVTGALWWSTSNWDNRISFPLDFANLANACDITRADGVSIFGSEPMIQATDQWAPTFCLDSDRTPVKHVQTGEPQARNLLKLGQIDAAMVSQAPDPEGFTRPVVNAPIAASGFAVTYAIDNENGQPRTDLKLNARLLAKLLTASYPAITAVKTGYSALKDNPLNISSDPEFLKLNPGVRQDIATQSAATILSLSSDSDVIGALTSYIDADPEARAWLDGKPDPWGMKVNPNYEGIALPVEVWPSLDTYEPRSIYQPGVNDCLYQAPVPYLPLVAAPLTRLTSIALAMQFSLANSQVLCVLPSGQTGSTDGAKLVALGRQTPGFRFMIGITSLADAERFEIEEAALQTHVTDESQATKGRSFVRPSDASLRAAAAFLKANPETDAWDLPYEKLVADADAADAYPGMMLTYASVPTRGLAKEDATAYAEWLRYVVTKGQQPGDGMGQLPDGYLPMTAANGLDGLVNYSLKAADAIEAQKGDVPEVEEGSKPSDPNVSNPPGSSQGTPPGGTSGTAPEDPAKEPTAKEPTAALNTVPTGVTGVLNAGRGGLIVPLVLLLAVVAGLLAGVTVARDKMRRVR